MRNGGVFNYDYLLKRYVQDSAMPELKGVNMKQLFSLSNSRAREALLKIVLPLSPPLPKKAL